MSEKVVVKTSFPIIGLLGLLFVTLKLCKVIDWSWWWVLLPFYGWIAILAIIFIGFGIVFAGAAIYDEYEKRQKRLAWKKRNLQ